MCSFNIVLKLNHPLNSLILELFRKCIKIFQTTEVIESKLIIGGLQCLFILFRLDKDSRWLSVQDIVDHIILIPKF
jgi:hypothetical protein